MRANLMGASAVSACWRYLGVYVASRNTRSEVLGPMTWEPEMEALMARRTWERHVCNIGARTIALVSRPGSPGYRAAAWNTYMASCILFPTQLCLPGVHEKQGLDGWLSKNLGLHGWCPGYADTRLTVAWGVGGGPRCPRSVAEAAGVIAWLRVARWGTRGFRRLQDQHWDALREWATREWEAADGHTLPGASGDLRTIASLLPPDFGTGAREQVRGKGGALYRLCWHQNHGQAFVRWTCERAARRLWLPTDGTEWGFVRASTSFAQAYHAFRVLANGLREAVGRWPTRLPENVPAGLWAVWEWTHRLGMGHALRATDRASLVSAMHS